MALIPQPIFYRQLKRSDGGKRRNIYVNNTDEEGYKGVIEDIEKPEWVELEGFYPGQEIEFPGKKKTAIQVNVNTDHKFFPSADSYDEPIKIIFQDETVLSITVTIQKIRESKGVYRGTFALDFGTTNSVYAYKTFLEDTLEKGGAFKRASYSREIPTFIFFKDVSDAKNPSFTIGNEARFDIKDHSDQTYSYFMSIKRMLGHDQQFIVMDEFGGMRPEHKQMWSAEDIAAFYIRAILELAEDEMEAKIPEVVATFPTLFPEDRKESLRSSFKKAFEMMGKEWNEDSLILDLNETNACTFSYIYGSMMDEFKHFQATERRNLLLAYDFGGGTIDISLVDASITRDRETASIEISTDLKGLTGELYYGGDNVSLEVYKMLKNRIALAAALKRHQEMESQASGEESSGGGEDDIWGGGGSGDDEKDDIWGAVDVGFDDEPEEKEEKEETGPSIMDDEEVADIENRIDPDTWKQAVQTVVNEQDIIQKAADKATDIMTIVEEVERAEGSYVGEDQAAKRAEIIEKAIETIYPTKYQKYEDDDPDLEEISRQLFHELWHEADLLKIRMVNSDDKVGRVQGTLKKVSKYTGIEPVNFNEIQISIAELNKQVIEDITRSINKAHQLYKNALKDLDSSGSGGGLVVANETKAPELKILLFGNGAHLPLVKEKVLEIFDVDENQLVMDMKLLKRACAIGACEEHNLRSAFGKGGFITYNFGDFLNKLPYSVGIQHEDLVLLGFENGFCPIFTRGMRGGEIRVIDSKTYKLLHQGLTELPVYANYHDGAKPAYIGWFDWTKPDGEVPLEELWTKEMLDKAAGCEQTPGTEEEEKDPFADEPEETTAEGDENAEEAAPVSPPQDDIFRVKMELLPSRKYRAYDLQTGKYYDFIPKKEKVNPKKNPFSGIH